MKLKNSPIIFALAGLLSGSPGWAEEPCVPIDRHAVVTRHNISWGDPGGRVPLGNGEFCFGADGTGLQTFSGNSMAHWGWHSFPLPKGCTKDQVPATGTAQTKIGGMSLPPSLAWVAKWGYENPHILNLGRLRLVRGDGRGLVRGDIVGLERTLDLWTGLQVSRYRIDGQPVKVETCVHPTLDMVAVRIESPLVASGGLAVALDFGYPTLQNGNWIGDFQSPPGNATQATPRGGNRMDIVRTLDETIYHASLAAGEGAEIGETTDRAYVVSARGSQVLEIACAYAPTPLPAALPSFAETERGCAAHWQSFWKSGGAIDLSASKDARWKELERRIVLSQYQMAAQSAGSWPSSEYGLMGIDMWRGQFHMEMVWWHLAHYALWNRWELGDKALGCYRRFEPVARKLASQVGLKGLAWGKMVGPEGRSACWGPSGILLWKQPHPIFFAELEYRLHPTRATLEKWAHIVQGTAEYMAGYPTRDPKTGIFHLQPCMLPSELATTSDSSFDLAYWRWGLDKAQEWRQRMGLPREPQWDEVRSHLAPIPVEQGVFVRSPEVDFTATYIKSPVDHPDQVGLFGMLPPIDAVDAETAHRTVKKTWEAWQWPKCWGWDYPWMAMAAARTGEPGIAVDALLKECWKNNYDLVGLNTGGSPQYLPGNGGLLYAVAMMAAGWDGAPKRHAPGFPDDGSWVVKWEGLKPAP